MTDNEIIKTLECLCGGGDSCIECAYHKKYRFDECRKQVAKDALDLIKRQKAENDSAKAKIEICAEVIERQDAEIKRVKECPKCVYEYDGEITEYCVQGPCSNFKTVEQIKAEAYKEFAERLKSYLLLNKKGEMSVVSFENIDNLLKEMVGEEE